MSSSGARQSTPYTRTEVFSVTGNPPGFVFDVLGPGRLRRVTMSGSAGMQVLTLTVDGVATTLSDLRDLAAAGLSGAAWGQGLGWAAAGPGTAAGAAVELDLLFAVSCSLEQANGPGVVTALIDFE